MKKLLSGIFFLTAIGLGFTACSDDDDAPAYNGVPEIETVGTYTGTWTRTDVSEGTVTTAQGTLIFEATDHPYVTNVTATCADFGVNNQSVANITYAGDRYVYDNMLATNDFGTTFYGKITLDFVADIAYQLTVKEGRKTYVYQYSFEGKRQ